MSLRFLHIYDIATLYTPALTLPLLTSSSDSSPLSPPKPYRYLSASPPLRPRCHRSVACCESIEPSPIRDLRRLYGLIDRSNTGFRWDRQWLVINYKGRAYTQRVEPKLALVEVQLPDEAFLENWEPTGSSYLDGVSVWEWSGAALDEGDDAAKWLSDYLGKPGRLFRFNAGNYRENGRTGKAGVKFVFILS